MHFAWNSKNIDERMRHFFFDEVLDEGCSQQEAFARVQMGPMVESVLAGYHATVFCYGQTGSGATAELHSFWSAFVLEKIFMFGRISF